MSNVREQIEEKVFQTIGTASMLWSETPKGVFESTAAKELGEKLCNEILALIPRWQSFDEAKPDRSWKIAVKFKGVIENDLHHWDDKEQMWCYEYEGGLYGFTEDGAIEDKDQWLRIPE